MSGPFATPTFTPSNPLDEALDEGDHATVRPAAAPISSPASPLSLPHRARPTRTRTLDKTTSMPPQSYQYRTGSSSTATKSPSLYSAAPSVVAKNSNGPPRRTVPDRSKRRSLGETQSVASQARQPHAQERSGPSEEELVRFAALCRRQYYDNDTNAARKVGETLNKLPPSSVAIYSRTMASVRSEYHRDKEFERRLHVETTLESILPGSTIKATLGVSLEDGLGGGVAAMRSKAARRARHAALKSFLDVNCVKAIPGCHPFFRSLYAVLWLQALESSKGGAGSRQVEWDVDVAVFSEAGGGEAWARDAIEALKGVLGMTERIKAPILTDTMRSSMFSEVSVEQDRRVDSSASNISRLSGCPEVAAAQDASTEPTAAPGHQAPTPDKKPAPAVRPHRASLRTRSPSDPFLDPGDKARAQSSPPALPPRQLSPSIDEGLQSPPLASPTSSTPFLAPSGLPSPAEEVEHVSTVSPVPSPSMLPSPRSPGPIPSPSVEPQVRTFTFPSYITNPELRALCRLFPDFVSAPARTRARFRSSSVSSTDRTKAQEEAGVNKDGGLAKVGHGELRICSGERAGGWRGTLWERILAWLRAFLRLD
ncbi:hypothetical protein JCM10212_004294 [Sporobolomyces blumeae]